MGDIVGDRHDGTAYATWIKAVNMMLLARHAGFFIDPNVVLLSDPQPTHWKAFFDLGWEPERMSAALGRFEERTTDPDGLLIRAAIRHTLGLSDELRKEPR
jgi:hypothetical protein